MNTKDKSYRGYSINTGNNANLSCNINTLNQIIDRLEYMNDKHSKVLAVRIDIMNDVDLPNGIERKDITRILENLKRSLEKKYEHSHNKLDFQYVWTTEKTLEDNQEHFHLFILVNGNTIQNGYSIKEALSNQVIRRLQTSKEGLVNFSNSNGKVGIMIRRDYDDYEEQMDKAVFVGSYLAKTYSKEYKCKGARTSSSSRLR